MIETEERHEIGHFLTVVFQSEEVTALTAEEAK